MTMNCSFIQIKATREGRGLIFGVGVGSYTLYCYQTDGPIAGGAYNCVGGGGGVLII